MMPPSGEANKLSTAIELKLRDASTGDVFRVVFPFASALSLASLLQRAREILGAEATPSLRLAFRDADGDLVTITSDADVQDALQQSAAQGKRVACLIMQNSAPKKGAAVKAAAKADAAAAPGAAAHAEQEPAR